MASPDRDEIRQLAVYGVPIQEVWTTVDAILRQLEVGAFQLPARLLDRMLRDDRIYGVLHTRLNGLFGSPLELSPADERPLAHTVCDEIKERWDDMFPLSQLKEVMAAGIMLGVGFGNFDWQRTEKKWMPCLVAHHLQNARYQWVDNNYHTVTMQGDLIVERDTGQWFVYTPFGHQWAYLRGAMRALARPWLMRTLTELYWGRYDEVHGMPTRKVFMPSNADQKIQKQILKEVSRMNSESTIRLLQEPNGTQKYDVTLLEAMSNGWETFEKHVVEENRQIAIVLLGQALSTEGSKGLGSHDKAGEEVRQDIKEADAKIARELRKQCLEWYCTYNYNDPTLAPKVEYIVAPPDDKASTASALLSFSQAIEQFRQSGIPIDVTQVMHTQGIPLIEGKEVQPFDEQKDDRDQEAKDIQQTTATEPGNDGDDDDTDTKVLSATSSTSYPTIYLIRHGSTEMNEGGSSVMRGWSDVSLNKEGRRMAKERSRDLALVPMDGIYTSDLPRASETAEIIARPQNTPVYPLKELRTWRVGSYQGQVVEDHLADIMYYIVNKDESPPNGEPFSSFVARALPCIRELFEEATTCAIVTHSRVVRLIYAWLKAGAGDDYDPMVMLDRHEPIEPGQMVKLVRINGEWSPA